MKFSFNYRKRKIELDLRVFNWIERFFGLMFTRKKNAKALLFDFKKPGRVPIHSWFVFFPFVAVWLDDENKIIDVKTIRPFTLLISPKKPFCKIIEIPINEKYKQVIELLNLRS